MSLQVDPNMDGLVSLQEYMAFMISRETENIQSISDIIQAFKALTHGGEKPCITSSEIYAVSILIQYLIIQFSAVIVTCI